MNTSRAFAANRTRGLTGALAWLAPAACGILLAAALESRAAEELPPPLPDDGAAPPPRADGAQAGPCANCAIIRSMRAVERDRPIDREIPAYVRSEQYQDTRSYSGVFVGPSIGLSFGPGTTSQPFVGAAGSPSMRQRIRDIVYEVILRYEDGRFGLLEQDDVGAFRVGDRVRVTGNRMELLPKQ